MPMSENNLKGITSPSDDIGIEEPSAADQVIDYMDLIRQNAFIGPYPLDVIIKSLKDQFNNYINLDSNPVDYVDIFYDQWHASMDAINDEDEEHRTELNDVLSSILEEFLSEITTLFQRRLTISFDQYDGAFDDYDILEMDLRAAYEFFILNARDNFKTVISKDIISRITSSYPDMSPDDYRYMETIRSYFKLYDPLVIAMPPEEFIKMCPNNEDIQGMYEDGSINGNFLRKYTAKLYQNDDFVIDIINYIVICQQFGRDVING